MGWDRGRRPRHARNLTALVATIGLVVMSGCVQRVSVMTGGGAEGTGDGRGRADFSHDGTLVAFPSFAPNLPTDGVDTNGLTDNVVKFVVG